MTMGLFGARKMIRAHHARISSLEEQAVLFRDAAARAEEHKGDLVKIAEETRRLSELVSAALDDVKRMSGKTEAIAADLEKHREMLVRMRNELVKLRVDVDQRAVEAETQTRALFTRLESGRR